MAQRQTLTFKNEYLKYNFIQEMNKLWNVFADDEIMINSKDIDFYQASKEIISSMEDGLQQRYTYQFKDNPTPITTTIDNNFILCCISGGKDSLATALHYKQLGYNIILYTVKGINKGYPEEYKAALNLAQALNLPLYVDEIKISGKKYWMEHPLKNQIIASIAIAYCLENNLPPVISFGNYREDGNERSHWGVNWTDNYDLWIKYNQFITYFVDCAKVNIPFWSEDEAWPLLAANFELVPLYQSCLMTVRNRNQLKQHNEEKYKIKLFNNRCGSCRKCCLEYVYFCDIGKFDYNKEYYKHCLEILKKKYQEYVGFARSFKNLEEVHRAYFGESNLHHFSNGKLI